MAEIDTGVEIVDVSTPSNMQLLGAVDTRSAWGIAVADDAIVVADGAFLDIVTTQCRSPEAHFAWDHWALDVEFEDRTLFGVTAWSWDFGDGSSSGQRNPVHTYAQPGIYAVTLAVTNEYGSDQVSRTVWVTAPGQIFIDVPESFWAFDWINILAGSGATSGCSADPPLYCPYSDTTRGQMAVFLLASKEGSGYTPPPAVGMFDDVPVSSGFAPWIEELANRGITAGCNVDPPLYCPSDPVTRDQMAVFLVTTFGLGN